MTEQNVSALRTLSVKAEQRAYVVSNDVAIAEASCSEDELLRAIYADETPIGLAVIKVQSDGSSYLLWRLMIDAEYQGEKYGSRAMKLLINEVKCDPNFSEFKTSVVPGDFSPQKFYESLGFELTGKCYKGEAVMRLVI